MAISFVARHRIVQKKYLVSRLEYSFPEVPLPLLLVVTDSSPCVQRFLNVKPHTIKCGASLPLFFEYGERASERNEVRRTFAEFFVAYEHAREFTFFGDERSA